MGPKYFGARRSFLAALWLFALGAALVIGGCGPLGGDDEPEEPPTTVESTGESGAGTPGASQDTEQVATPEFDGIITDDPVTSADDATPESGSDDLNQVDQDAESENAASPVSQSGIGDGTSGATPDPNSDPGASDDESSATPEVTGAVTVSTCSPNNVPEFAGESDAFVVVEDLNFRAGPGSDCEAIGGGPLTAGTDLTLTSDPVLREREGDGLWVRVDVDGEQGWVVVEFIEPQP